MGHDGGGGIGAAQDHQVIEGALRRQVPPQRAHIGPIETLHPLALEPGDIGLRGLQVGGAEGHLVAQVLKDPKQIHQAQGAGFPVGSGHVVVHHQGPPPDPALLGALQILPPHAPAGDLGTPAGQELLPVDRLVTLHARDHRPAVGPRAHPLEVHDPRRGLVVDPIPRRPDPHRQVRVLVIGGGEVRIEPAEALEQGTRYRERRTGAVVGLPQIAVLGLVGIVQVPVVPGRAVRREDRPRLLLAPVGIDQPGAHQARVGPLLEGPDQGVQPARLDLGVVVEEHQVLAAGTGRPPITGPDKTQILGISD